MPDPPPNGPTLPSGGRVNSWVRVLVDAHYCSWVELKGRNPDGSPILTWEDFQDMIETYTVSQATKYVQQEWAAKQAKQNAKTGPRTRKTVGQWYTPGPDKKKR